MHGIAQEHDALADIIGEAPVEQGDSATGPRWHSRLFDVHKWSDYPEINALVDELYAHTGKAEGKSDRRCKRTLKIVLLNLYVNYLADPTLWTAYHRNQNSYRIKSRYNHLHLECKPITHAADKLKELGLIDESPHYCDRETNRTSRITRMRASDKLRKRFDALGRATVRPHPEREKIIKKDEHGRPMEYGRSDGKKDDSNVVKGMRKSLDKINELLEATDIQCPLTPVELCQINAERRSNREYEIDLTRKELHRVFNGGKFTLGGRFYGGWWEIAPKRVRPLITINGEETVERDYKALHPSLLYIKETGKLFDGDPYLIPPYESDPDMRKIIKGIVLILLNAKNRETAKKAISWRFAKKLPSDLQAKLAALDFDEVFQRIAEAHPSIWRHFGAGMGRTLQYWDSKIADKVLSSLAGKGIPCLPVHDSFITQRRYEADLVEAMGKAFHDDWGVYPKID